ncbi:hypothetical protein CQA57_06985 [Helicobacter anseris]|uniref:Uncharacterized protein n=2 Tax=Helicobacter anseris TaxID=375926 RepID=A0A3D8J534_9HELI|nr:hypothetical protein CQA57_06985 [Helicobacter anseris]
MSGQFTTMRKLFIFVFLSLFVFAKDKSKIIDFFEKYKNNFALPESLSKAYDEILNQVRLNNNSSVEKKLTIFLLTSLSVPDVFNVNFEKNIQKIKEQKIDIQTAYVFAGFPKEKNGIEKFLFRMGGLREDPRKIIEIIKTRAMSAGMTEKEYMQSQADKEGIDIQSYAKKLYYDEIGKPEKINTILKILPHLFKRYSIDRVPAYFIGECPIFNTDFDLDECDFDYYAYGDMSLETFLKYSSINNQKYNKIYFSLIESVR